MGQQMLERLLHLRTQPIDRRGHRQKRRRGGPDLVPVPSQSTQSGADAERPGAGEPLGLGAAGQGPGQRGMAHWREQQLLDGLLLAQDAQGHQTQRQARAAEQFVHHA